MRKFVILTFITVFAYTGVAAAKGPGQRSTPGTFWEKDVVAKALALSEEERARLMALQNEHRETVKDLKEELREERKALREIMEGEEFSPTDAREQFYRREQVRSGISKELFELRMEQRQILGQERYAKLRKIEKRIMKKRRRNIKAEDRSRKQDSDRNY